VLRSPAERLSNRGPQFWAHQLHAETEYQAWVRCVGIEPPYGRWARTRGESEHTFWFIQQDFVLKYPDAATLEGLNETWTAWMAWHHWHH
jgi:hypothetical protein